MVRQMRRRGNIASRAGDRTDDEIADELALSVKTISTYRARLLEKMHMKSNAELTRYAIEHQLID